MYNDKNEKASPLLRIWRWIFEKLYDSFMKRGWKTKLVMLVLSFFVFFWLVTENIDSILLPFHRENGSTKDHFIWFLERSRPPVPDCYVIFVSWLLVIPIMSILSWRFARPNIFVESELLCLVPFFFAFKWGFSPVFFLGLACHSIFIAILFRKRYLWIAALFITYLCLSLYFIGVTICFTDISDFF
jgi:hypothetical protein